MTVTKPIYDMKNEDDCFRAGHKVGAGQVHFLHNSFVTSTAVVRLYCDAVLTRQ